MDGKAFGGSEAGKGAFSALWERPEALAAVLPGPYHLFGYCAGGVVAYEIAQRLIAGNRPPTTLAMVDTPCPPRAGPVDLGRTGYFVSRIGSHTRAMFHRGPRNAISYLFGRAKFLPTVLRLPGFRSLRPEQLAVVAHREALHRYRPAPIACSVDLYLASEPWPSAAEDTRQGWRQFAPLGRSHIFPGTHEGIMKDPAVLEVADRLNEALVACESVRHENHLPITESTGFQCTPQKALVSV